MTTALALKAFIVGILSASSLLIGAIASFYWRPEDRKVAFMMALGGGALLAALTLDLAGEALHRGHHLPLCFGCLIGGLLFIGLDTIVSDYGGFKRKAATTVYHMRRQKHRQYKQILTGIGRTDIFKHLHTRHFKQLSSSIQTQDFRAGEILYHPGDPSDHLYITLSGEIELFYPMDDPRPRSQVGPNQAFGRFSFHTGTPHAAGAVALADTTVLMLPRRAFDALLMNSATLQQVIHRWLRSSELIDYMSRKQRIAPETVREWTDRAVKQLMQRGRIPAALEPVRNKPKFLKISGDISGAPFFSGLPGDELDTIGSVLLYRSYDKGQTIFRPGEPGDRMYITDYGEISLINSQAAGQSATAGSAAAFGVHSFICGSCRSGSAIATGPSGVWILRRTDLAGLLHNTQVFRERVQHYLKQDVVASYLGTTLHFDTDKTARFVQDSVKAVSEGCMPVSADALANNVKAHSGAAIAIWLGIMLDGIPESLVIGSSMIHAQVSISLLVGLFIANFPESLSSSIGMNQEGLSRFKILCMWSSIVLITGIGAAVGNIFFAEAEPVVFTLVEGIAAGAMLTMIAQTMLPEAYFKGGSIVGFATLLGFLAAIASKTLE